MALLTTGTRAPGGLAAEPWTVASPDGHLSLWFTLKTNPPPYAPGERAYYGVSYKGSPILADSPLGLAFGGTRPLEGDFEVLGAKAGTGDSTWENHFGARRVVRDHYHQLTVSLRERGSPRRRIDVIFRAYNEGVAFRYWLPEQEVLGQFTISSENTGFYFPRNFFAYALDLGSYTTAYESEFRRVSLNQIKPNSIIGLPLLVEIPNGPWLSLLEADLTDYAGMYVGGVAGVPNALVSKLSPLPNRSDQAVSGRTPKATPWRVLLVSPKPGGLIESSDLIDNLSAPSAIANTTWIEPGKAAWDWWSGRFARGVNFKPGVNTETMRHYIDFAARHHLRYMLVDAGWSPRDDITHWVPAVDLPELLTHARQLGIKVLVWMHWTAVKKQIDEAFPLYEKWGVAGVKIDFMNRDDQEMVNFYQEMVRKAAEHHLVVDFHGAYKPTGLERTYPNLLTREAVMGMEYSKGSDRVTPEHNVTLPFTRMLAGPMDYTPGCFQNATREQFKPRRVEPMCQGTRAHQLAMYVVFLSPLVMLSDYPESYEGEPGMKFLEQVETVWDETKVLNGEPAKYVTIARRHGQVWYLGSMTNWDARDLEIPLTFLGGGQYEAETFADGSDADTVATRLSTTRKFVNSTETLPTHMAPGGGFAAILRRVQ